MELYITVYCSLIFLAIILKYLKINVSIQSEYFDF